MAEVLFRCPHCPQTLRASTSEVGKRVECAHCHTESVVPQPAEKMQCGRCQTVVQISIYDMRETFPCPGCGAELRFSSAPAPAVTPKLRQRRRLLFFSRGWRIVDCLSGDVYPIETFPFEIGSDEHSHLVARGALAQHCALETAGKSLKLLRRDPRARILVNGVETAGPVLLPWGQEHTLQLGPHYYILHSGWLLDRWESRVDASQWFICDTQTRLIEGPYTRRELAAVLEQHPRDPERTILRPRGLLAGFPLHQFGAARELFRFQPKPLPSASPEPPAAETAKTLGPPVLRLQDISLEVAQGPTHQRLLHELSLELPGGHLAAIVGASGCGKTTLLKVIAGIMEPTAGRVFWHNRNLAEEDLAPSEIGYVPQFSIVFEHLTIWESMDNALRLRIAGLTSEQRRERIERILREVGLLNIAHRRVRVLSGGERRRLALALESVTEPALLLCDEVTSGLDPKAEEEVVELMHRLSREKNRLVISVTHSLRHLDRYDSVAVMYQGCLVYHGSSQNLARYFGVRENSQVFTELAKRPAIEWHAQWQSCRASYSLPVASAGAEDGRQPQWPDVTPGALTQFWLLWRRRMKIFFRDRGQLWLHLALLFGFPCLVVIFALHGLPQMQSLSMGTDVPPLQQLKETTGYLVSSMRVGSLVSALVMFQVILLALMGANNAAREVAAERLIFEKEKLGGLRPVSYLASKALFLAVLVAAQSVWMAAFVSFVCRFPGDLLLQTALLLLGNGAITATALAISSLLKSPEQASLVSIYLVGFQIPLSGAFLALPELLGKITRPFIAAYWSWSGVVETMRDTRFYDAVLMVTQTDLAGIPLCFWTLGCHVVFGLMLAYIGCRQSRWELQTAATSTHTHAGWQAPGFRICQLRRVNRCLLIPYEWAV
ncbi:MAG: ABC transporter G family ATP-binding protein/permease [Verrucomicrobiae bacterium]|nr:ABC transporter G family ATP-binding protein/permease [Verrucomicrobiae bacterium]